MHFEEPTTRRREERMGPLILKLSGELYLAGATAFGDAFAERLQHVALSDGFGFGKSL